MISTLRTSEVPVRVVRAAVALFSRQGYRGTTTQDIARLAEVSEVTVYRYFKHKEDIFWSALASCFHGVKERLDQLDAALKDQPPEYAVPRIVGLLANTIIYSPELPRLVAVAFLELGGKAEEVCYEYLAPLLNTIAHYLEANIHAGRIRKLDPAMVTGALVLTVVAQPEISRLIDGYKHPRPNSRDTVDGYSSFWLNILKPMPNMQRHILMPYQEAPSF